jgi:hypothetical protein
MMITVKDADFAPLALKSVPYSILDSLPGIA